MKLGSLRMLDRAHSDCIWTAAWVPASNDHSPLLLTGSVDQKIKMWKSNELTIVRENTSHNLGVISVAAHPSGSFAASSSIDCTLRVFNIDSNDSIAIFEDVPSEIWQLRFSPKGNILAVAGGSSASVFLWDTITWKLVQKLSVPRPKTVKLLENFVLSVAWSHDGCHVACGLVDGTIAVFDVAELRFLHHLLSHCEPVRSLVYSPVNESLLFSASDDKYVHLHDASKASFIAAMSGHTDFVLSVDCSPDGGACATGSSDGTVKLWDLKAMAAVQTVDNHKAHVWEVTFRRLGEMGDQSVCLASVEDQSIWLYDYS